MIAPYDSEPASSLQRQFWLLAQLQPESSAYHVAALFRITGPLDIHALARACERLAARHAALRTTFAQQGGTLLQRVHADLPPAFRIEHTAQDADSVVLAAELRAPFDLEVGPLLRFGVWPASEGGHWLTWTMHHIVCDLASKNRLAHELGLDYARELGLAQLGSLPHAWPEPTPTHYPDFAAAEQTFLASETAKHAEDYFAEHLRAPSDALALPEDHPRPKLQSPRGRHVPFALPASVVSALQARSRELATKPFLLLLCGYATLLARYSRHERVTLGVPFTNRRRQADHDTVGCFVNNLPLAVDLTGEPTFAELFRRVRASMLGHHRHQELPLERIVARVKPPRDPSRNALFQAGFAFEPAPTLTLAGLETQSLDVHAGGAQLDVFMTLWETADGFSGRLEYCSDLYDLPNMQQLVRCYLALLEHALAPEAFASTALMRLPLMAAEDHDRVVHTYNRTERAYPGPQRMHEAFLAQCARTPDATALRFGARDVSYDELRARASALAGELRALGIGRGDRVALFMERSLEMVVSIYGTLLAGAAYVPLDPDFPAQRIGFMLEDAQPRAVLSHAQVAARWTQPSLTLRLVDFEALPLAAAAPVVPMAGSDPAYVIFTSGSTGRPKGVPNTHQGICNRIAWMQEAYRLRANEAVLHKTPYSFDVSTWEFFWPLTVGARLEIAPPGAHRDPAELAALIVRAGITTVHFVPSMLEAFVAHPAAASCTSLRRILCSGEALGAALVQRTAQLLPAELHNLYGPTEAAVDVSAWACRQDLTRDPVPIGKPIANTQLYVLDAYRAPVPAGVLGELYIGGVQVALGYINRPELSAERFLPDPFTNQPEARLYRTGDLARWLADGNLGYAGRIDHQVKVRGQRIELGEIEAVLDQHVAVRQSVVVARRVPGATTQDAQLVAYLVPSAAISGSGPGGLVESVRAHLRERLPAGMLPNQIVIVAGLPLTASGKVDRKALPEPSAASAAPHAPVAPRDAREVWLCERWCELLGVQRVGVHDNIFELGATSLMCAQLVGKIRKHLRADVPLVRLFEHPTIAALADHLTELAAPTAANATDSGLDQARQRATRQRAAAQRPLPRKR